MSTSDEYSRKAAECFACADASSEPHLKAELYALAEAWVRLAARAQKARGGNAQEAPPS